jgi:hypothetical protein
VVATRVVLATRPRLLCEMMGRLIRKAPGLDLVAEVADLQQLDAVIEAKHPQCVVTTSDEYGSLAPQVQCLHRAHPRIRLLALAPDGQTVQVGFSGSSLRFGSLTELMTLIRGT